MDQEAYAEEIGSLKTQLSDIYNSIAQSSLSQFPHYLSMETYRRTLFLSLREINEAILSLNLTLRSVSTRHRHLTTPKKLNPRSSHSDIPSETLSSGQLNVTPTSSFLSNSGAGRKSLKGGKFSGLQEGNLTLPLGYYGLCVPVDADDPLSIIAYSLQMQSYINYIDPFLKIEELRAEDVDSELLYGSGHSHTADFPNEEEAAVHFKVKVMFARQFQALRLSCGIPHFDFLLSICKKSDIVAMKLGKSKSVFLYSHDKRYIFKQISGKEMVIFEDMAPNYFRHMAKHIYHQMPSQLVKTIGAFRVTVKSDKEVRKTNYLLTENLEVVMAPGSKIFDLKGTLNARRYVKTGETRTKMDLNFTEEYHSLPICLHLEDKQRLDAGLWNDSLFLSKQNVIDYSLLVIINEEDGEIAMGIIDYMQHYTVDKAVESKYKTVVGREQPTITDPAVYKTRFREQLMFEYFVGVTS